VKRLFLLVVLVGLVPAGVAASVRSVTAPGPVVAIAMNGRQLAYADGTSARDCDRVRLWNLQTGRVTTFGRTTPCVQTSTGRGIAAVALASGRVLWLHYIGGNIREWRLFTATRSAPRPRLLRLVARDVDAAPPIVLGDGHGSRFGDLLPYAVDRDVIVLRKDGARRFVWRAPARVTALSALFGKIAVASEGGVVTVLDASGTPLMSEEFEGEIAAVELSGDGILVQRGRTLELRRSDGRRAFALPAGAKLEDTSGDRAFYVAAGQIRQLLLSTGAESTIAPGSHVQVDLSTVTVAAGRRVTVRPVP
jgi:outer membrane protein assembly factor BamB